MNTEPAGCWHCGEPLPRGVQILASVGGQPRAMCCHGCRAAAEWIEQLGLADYYRLRTAAAPKPDTGGATRDPWERAQVAHHVIRVIGPLREAQLSTRPILLRSRVPRQPESGSL